MKIITGRGGEAHVTSQQFRQILTGLIGEESCVLQSGDNLTAELSTNNLLKINSGIMYHHGNISGVDLETYDEVTIPNGTQGMQRIDLVVCRYEKNSSGIESCEWVHIMGTPSASNPVAPSYTVGDLREGDMIDDCPVFEIHLNGITVTEVKKLLNLKMNGTTSIDKSLFAFYSFWEVQFFNCWKDGDFIHINGEFYYTGQSTNFKPNNKYSLNAAASTDESIRPVDYAKLDIVLVDPQYLHAVSGFAMITPTGDITYSFPDTTYRHVFISGAYKAKDIANKPIIPNGDEVEY